MKAGKIVDRYLWGAKQDELLCENNEWMLGDHLNTVRAVVKNGECVHKRLKYSAFGELLNEPDDEIAFAYTGKLFDAKTGLQWNINRWYDPKVGRWISEDPIGFGDGVNTSCYVKNRPIQSMDSLGLWKQARRNSTIYISEGEEDSLYSLAQEVSGDWRDWVCIWPIINSSQSTSDWNSYPYASPCARADVKNLLNETGTKLNILAASPTDPYLKSLEDLLKKPEIRIGGQDIAKRIAAVSGQGATPLGKFFIAGHSNGFSIGNGTRFFTPSDLFVVAKEKDNTQNTFVNAQNKIGPPKCWFTRNAHVGGLGCTTTPYAQNFANSILRNGATSWGIRPYIYGAYLPGNSVLYGLKPIDQFYSSPVPGPHDSRAFGHFRNLEDLSMNPEIWVSYPGQQ